MTLDVFITGKIQCPRCGEKVELPELDVRAQWRISNFAEYPPRGYAEKCHYRFFCCPKCDKRLLKLQMVIA